MRRGTIRWLRSDAGGRSRPPTVGSRYAAIGRFRQNYHDWKEHSWSVVVEPLSNADECLTQTAMIGFLVNDAPTDWMAEGAHFELYEGVFKVAEVDIT